MFFQRALSPRCSLGFNIIAGNRDPEKLLSMYESIAPLADQIVVIVDHRAPLDVEDISRGYSEDVYRYPWENFAVARNHALDYTWTDYIAWIDTDEFIYPYDASRLYNLMTAPLGFAYYIWQVSPDFDGRALFVPQVRLFPNRPGVQWEIPIHEQILPSLSRAGITTRLTDLRIEHSGYTDVSTVYEKHFRNLELLEKRIAQHPEDSFSRSNYEKALAFGPYIEEKMRAA